MGKTAVGRATIRVLAINDPGFRAVRIALRDEGFDMRESCLASPDRFFGRTLKGVPVHDCAQLGSA
jgi:hypothetical protein